MPDDFIVPSPSDSVSISTDPTPLDPFEASLDQETPVEAKEPTDPFRGTKHKIKAKGKEIELDYETLLKKAEKAEGADVVFQEAAATKKELKALQAKIARLSSGEADPFEVIETMGFENAKKFADTLTRKQLEWEELSEAEQNQVLKDMAAEEDKRKLSAYEKREEEARNAASLNQAMSLIDQEVGEALAFAKEQGLSLAESPRFAEKIVDELLAWLEYAEAEEKSGRSVTTPPPSAKDVAARLLARKTQGTQEYLKKLDVKSLKSMLSKEQLAELRQAEIDDLYSTIPRNASKRQAEDQINPFETKKVESPRSSNDWFAAMDKKLGVKR